MAHRVVVMFEVVAEKSATIRNFQLHACRDHFGKKLY